MCWPANERCIRKSVCVGVFKIYNSIRQRRASLKWTKATVLERISNDKLKRTKLFDLIFQIEQLRRIIRFLFSVSFIQFEWMNQTSSQCGECCATTVRESFNKKWVKNGLNQIKSKQLEEKEERVFLFVCFFIIMFAGGNKRNWLPKTIWVESRQPTGCVSESCAIAVLLKADASKIKWQLWLCTARVVGAKLI